MTGDGERAAKGVGADGRSTSTGEGERATAMGDGERAAATGDWGRGTTTGDGERGGATCWTGGGILAGATGERGGDLAIGLNAAVAALDKGTSSKSCTTGPVSVDDRKLEVEFRLLMLARETRLALDAAAASRSACASAAAAARAWFRELMLSRARGLGGCFFSRLARTKNEVNERSKLAPSGLSG